MVVGELPTAGYEGAYEFAASYLSIAGERLEDAATRIYLAYDPGLEGASGSSPRFASIAGANPKLAEGLAKRARRQFDVHDLIVVFGPEMVELAAKDDGMRWMVASDLSLYFDIAFPVQCFGPIAAMMPTLTQVAAMIVLPGKPAVGTKVGGTGKQSVTDVIHDRADRAITTAMAEKAERDFGKVTDGSMGLLLTAYPLIDKFARHVSDEAKLQVEKLSDEPMPFEIMILTVHNPIAQAMRNLGMTVSDRAPTSTLSS